MLVEVPPPQLLSVWRAYFSRPSGACVYLAALSALVPAKGFIVLLAGVPSGLTSAPQPQDILASSSRVSEVRRVQTPETGPEAPLLPLTWAPGPPIRPRTCRAEGRLQGVRPTHLPNRSQLTLQQDSQEGDSGQKSNFILHDDADGSVGPAGMERGSCKLLSAPA